MTNTGTTGQVSERRRWVILGVIYVGMLAFAMVLQSVPPALPLILKELGLSHTQGGLLMSFFALPGIILAIPAGLLADRFNQKPIGLISLALLLLGTSIVASGKTLEVLALGRVISGIGGVTFLVMAPQLLAQWFAGREIGVAMGVFNTGMPLGTIVSLNLVAILAVNQGWRTGIWVSTAVTAIALIVFALFFRSVPRSQTAPSLAIGGVLKGILSVGKPIWLIGIAWALFNAALIPLFTFTPDFLTAAGFPVARAGFITGLVMFPALLSVAIGLFMDRIGLKKSIFIIGGLGLMLLLALVPYAIGWIMGLMLLLGVFQSMVPVSVFALAPDVTQPEKLGLGFGIIATCTNVGILVGPATSGWIKDATNSYYGSYMLMAGFAFLMVLVVGALTVSLRALKAPKP